MDRDLYVMGMFLVMSQEVLNRYKAGIRLTDREKYLCLLLIARTAQAHSNLSQKKLLG